MLLEILFQFPAVVIGGIIDKRIDQSFLLFPFKGSEKADHCPGVNGFFGKDSYLQIFKVYGAVEVQPFSPGVALNGFDLAFADPAVGGAGIVLGMGRVKKVNAVLRIFAFFECLVEAAKEGLLLGIKLPGHELGLLVDKPPPVQQMGHAGNRVVFAEGCPYVGADCLDGVVGVLGEMVLEGADFHFGEDPFAPW